MKTTDSIGRATWGYIDYQPIASTTERENQWMQFLNVHGLVNSFYFHELTKDSHRSPKGSSLQLRKLRAGKLIEYPFAQRKSTFAPWNNYFVYQLTKLGKSWLDNLNLLEETVIPTGHWLHQYMTACISASIDIMAKRAGFGYIPAHKLLERNNSTIGTVVNGKKLIPDQLFALDYGGKFRVFAVEADRGTEQVSEAPNRKSYESSVKQYIEFIGGKQYKDHYGLNAGMLLLYVFARRSDQSAFMEMVRKHTNGKCSYILTQTVPDFDTTFKPPKVFIHLFDEPWERVGYVDFYINKV